MKKNEKLFDQFPPVTTKEWMDKIHSDLKGEDFNTKLIWRTSEGFDVMPFYRMEDIENLMVTNTLPGEFPYVRGTKIKNNNWSVRQNLEVSDYQEANRKALTVLMKGVDSLGFLIADPETVNENNFKVLLNDIHIENIEINFLCIGKELEILDLISGIAKERGLDPDKIHGALEADPIGMLLVNGKLDVSVEKGFDSLASLTTAAMVLPNLRSVHLNASNFGNAGAGIVQELAFGISMGCEYMHQLTQRGLSTDISASKIRFSFSTGSNYFFEIAKLRAARLLWSAVTNVYKPECVENIRMKIHSVTTRWNKTLFDPYVNMLRTQTEAMSAILGGTDSLTVEPFDIVFRQPDDFSERIARNQQLILKEESYFDKVADPAAGSYYIENLTDLLAESAWRLFLEIEQRGGFLAELKSGLIQKRLSDYTNKRKIDIAIGKEVLLGTNLFPEINENPPSNIDPGRIFRHQEPEIDLQVEPVRLLRGSEDYERVRIADEKGV